MGFLHLLGRKINSVEALGVLGSSETCVSPRGVGEGWFNVHSRLVCRDTLCARSAETRPMPPSNLICVPESFPTAEHVAVRVAAVRERNWELRARLKLLREELADADAEALLCGPGALAMPEDLGDWSKSGPRVRGIVTRIYQTQAQSQELADIVGETRR